MTNLSRRNFLRGSALIPLISPMVAISRLKENNSTNFDSQEAWVRKARNAIPATKDLFFQTAGIGPSPKEVISAVSSKLRFQNKGPVHPKISKEMGQVEPQLRKLLGKTFGSHEDEVALTHSTSEGINIASWSINWQKDDEVIITNQEHPANTIPWYSLSTRYGIKIKRLNFDTGTNILSEIKKHLTDKTRMVSIPHVSRNNGRAITLEESKQIAKILRSKGIRYHLDGAQGPLCVPFNFHDLECDYYSTCGHKWILGPKGTGAFFCRKDILDKTRLTWTGSHSHESMDQNGNLIKGKVGKDLDIDKGYEAAVRCALSLVAQAKKACSDDLNKIKCCVKLTGFVNSINEFTDQPKVINGASDTIVKIFADKGMHTRAAVSVNSLPLGVAVEVDAIFELN